MTIKTRNKSPFKAYDLDMQKRSWLNTNRVVKFGNDAIKRPLMAKQNLEGALWVMETSNNMRTFAYSSSPHSDGKHDWSAISWTNPDMWDNLQYAPNGNISVLFVNTETGQRAFIEVPNVVNRTGAFKKVANPIQFIDDNNDQWMCNWSLQKWWKRGHKEQCVFDAVYIFWQAHSACVKTYSPLI